MGNDKYIEVAKLSKWFDEEEEQLKNIIMIELDPANRNEIFYLHKAVLALRGKMYAEFTEEVAADFSTGHDFPDTVQ